MSFYSRFAEYYEKVFPFRNEVYRFLKRYAGHIGNRLLDVGCGPGHYCGHFAGEGFRIEGIDLDASMIAEAAIHYPKATFHCLDMRHIDQLEYGYNCIWSIGNVLSHMPQQELDPLISKIHTILVPGGIWIMQVIHWDTLMTMSEYIFPLRTIADDNVTVTFSRRYSSITTASLQFSCSLRDETKLLFEEQVTLYPVTLDSYLSSHEFAGFHCEAISSDFNDTPLQSEPGTGLVLVFRKQ